MNLTQLPTKEQLSVEIDRRQCVRLSEFVKKSWHILEPTTKLVWGNVLDIICSDLEDVFHNPGFQPRRLYNVPPGSMKSLLVSVMFPAWVWTIDPTKSFTGAAHEQGLAIRDARKMRILIESEWYQARWPLKMASDQNAKTSFENEKLGFRQAVPFGSLTGRRADFLLIDDPISAENANSEAALNESERIFKETLPTRVNNDQSAIIIIMQRLHERDPSGLILAHPQKYGYKTLIFPMRFEEDRADPQDWRTQEGELLFPERFSEEAVSALEEILGSYGCTPKESPILMADLSMKPISEIVVGDEIIGFANNPNINNHKYARQRLVKTKVKNVFKYENAEVFKLKLDSGKTIRCTKEHKWFIKCRNDGNYSGRVYAPAKVGTTLSRICDDSIYVPQNHELRDLGWLAGFFDGDGSVSYSKRRQNEAPVATICFYQGYGRNAPNCERLEKTLDRFGFQYRVYKDERKDPKVGANYEYRCYSLINKSLETAQKFLHVVQPTKWRDRIIEGSLTTKFIKQKERVISIEFDSIETVYALETETGNYIVWGLASSNSAGQLQQSPVPRDGGLFNREWFKPLDAIPNNIRWTRGWDLAATTNATSAYTVGVKLGKTPDGKIVIGHVVRGRWSPEGVYRVVNETAENDGVGVRISIPKDPGQAGVAQQKQFALNLSNFDVRFSPETGDKVTRAMPFSAQAEAGNVYYLKGDWNAAYFDEISMFPNSKFLDQVDATSRAYAELLKMEQFDSTVSCFGPRVYS